MTVIDKNSEEIKAGDFVIWRGNGDPWYVARVDGSRVYIAPDADFTPGDWIEVIAETHLSQTVHLQRMEVRQAVELETKGSKGAT